ncbi:MAG: hypothetical protein KY475_01400 [Planctomycetes bacterium]|nr:hypothetical protein [Planctomycetota bacterium]
MSQSLVRTVIGLLGCIAAAQGFADEPPSSAVAAKTGKVRLMSARRELGLRSYLPNVEEQEIQAIIDDPELIIYTDREMPECYQIWDGQLPGLHAVSYNISADEGEPFGNGNIEFPWGHAAGTHRAKNAGAFRFVRLPKDDDGATMPVVWYQERMGGDSQPAYKWVFPVGTVFGEVLTVGAPTGDHYTFEMRLRIREEGDWAVDVYRPFPTAESLSTRIKELRPAWSKNAQLARLVKHLDSPAAMRRHVLADQHPRRVFYQAMGVDYLPSAGDDELVVELLTETKFRSALGSTWRKSTNGLHTCAPTTTARFHIVPANYDGGFIEADRVSCMRCHETTTRHVDEFQAGRDWYGRVRGSDGIFSFHPFEPSSISYNGYGGTVQMRGDFVRQGILERFNPRRHPSRFYNIVSRLRRR